MEQENTTYDTWIQVSSDNSFPAMLNNAQARYTIIYYFVNIYYTIIMIINIMYVYNCVHSGGLKFAYFRLLQNV